MTDPMEENQSKSKIWVLLCIVVMSLFGVFLLQPIHQDPDYHSFADTRLFFGIPNFLNVVSNLPFLFAGGSGLVKCLKNPSLPYRLEWSAAFIGIALVAAGSAYYHWSPNSNTLVWDRLPMTFGFMALLSAILAEYVSASIGRSVLLPSLFIGAFSVGYWHISDDLRLYVWVQFMPLIVVSAVLIMYRSKYSHQRLLLIALAFYILAKVAEELDAEIFKIFASTISGHTIKHLCAAAACYCLAVMVGNRQVRGNR
jgi:hypothetical protein